MGKIASQNSIKNESFPRFCLDERLFFVPLQKVMAVTVIANTIEIGLIVVDSIAKEAWIYELKKQGYRYKEDEFKEKVDTVLEQTPELRKLTIHLGSLSLEDI